MPLLLQENWAVRGEWGLWEIEESEAELLAQLSLFPQEREQLAAIKGAERRREFLAARLLLHRMSGRAERGELIKDKDGKPHLAASDHFVSISHTVGFSAAIAHPRSCGIDVQRIVPRIRRLACKFVGEAEGKRIRPESELLDLHYLWSAKEALYKAYGRRQLDFKQHLFIDIPKEEGRLCTEQSERCFDLAFREFSGFVLVGAVEKG